MADVGEIEYTISVETRRAFTAADELDSSLNKVEGSTRRADKEFNQLNTSLTKVAKSVAAVVSVGALVNEFKKAVDVTRDFNQTMSNLSALTGLTGSALDDLASKAQAIGSTTSLSASQAASAMQLIGSKAPELLKTADGLTKVTEAAVVLAEASGSDMTTAAGILTGVMNQFNLVAEDSDRIINTLAAGAALGASAVEQTAAALARAGTQANESNVSIEQFTGAVQALAKGEITASDAGTALRNTLLILDNQMDKNLKPSVVGLDKALGNLKKAQAGGLDMLKLFGRENVTAANVLLNNIDVYNDVTKAVTNTNAAYDQQALRNDNLATDVKNLGSAYESLQLTIGELADDSLRSLTQSLTGAMLALSDTSEGTSKLESLLQNLSTVGIATGAVIAARLVGSMGAYSAAQAKAAIETVKGISATQASAAAVLRRAEADKNAARAATLKAAAEHDAARGTNAHTLTLQNLSAARQRDITATAAHSAAAQANASVIRASTIAMNGLKAAMGLVGGPLGVATLAAVAIFSYSQKAKQAREDTLQYANSVGSLTGKLKEMTNAQKAAEQAKLAGAEEALRSEIERLEKQYESLTKQIDYVNSQSKTTAILDRSAVEAKRKLAFVALELENTQKQLNQVMFNASQITAANNGELRNEYVTRIGVNEQLGIQAKLQQHLNNIMGQAPSSEPPSLLVPKKAPEPIVTSEDGQKAIKMYEDQIALLGKTGAARAELAALQRLGADATDAERERIAELAVEIYNLEQAEKKLTSSKGGLTTAQKELNQANENAKRGNQANADTLTALNNQIKEVGLSARELAQFQAELSLNDYATEQQIQGVRNLSGALFDLREQERLRATAEQDFVNTIGETDPVAKVMADEQAKLDAINIYRQMNLDSAIDFQAMEDAVKLESELKKQAAMEETFRKQSEFNNFLFDTFDALGAAGANAMSGLITGTMTAKDAMRSLAMTVLNQAISAIVQMGIEQVKNLVMGQAAGAAATASTVAQAAAISAAMATPAALASLATLGANAVPAQAGIATTIGMTKGLSFGGGRQFGGGVDGNKFYKVNEGGKPEIFKGSDGNQYMMPNQAGEVVSNKDASRGGGGLNVKVNLYQDQSRAGQVDTFEDDEGVQTNIFVADIMGGGERAQALESTYGLQRQGR